MSNTFNFKYLTENSSNLESKMIKGVAREMYLNTAIASLRRLNTFVTESTKSLYSQVLEAESKEDENKLFADYFGQFKDVFDKFKGRIEEMEHRSAMAIETLGSANSDLIDSDQYISEFEGLFSYSGWKFKNLSDTLPKVELRTCFQRDFDTLGRVMQDEGIKASPIERVKIIAQVCNDFCKNSKHWYKKVTKDILGEDCEECCDASFTEFLYSYFREKEEFEVNKGTLYKCKDELNNIEEYKISIYQMCDRLIEDIDFISYEISSYLFRNKDNTLKIKTPTDGVIDRDYRLDSYAMNQVNIFLKSKISHISKVINVYTMAISIKIDALIDNITQCKNILRMVQEKCDTRCCEVEPDFNDGEVSEDPINSDEPEVQDDEDAENMDNVGDNFSHLDGFNDGEFGEDNSPNDVEDENFDEATLFESFVLEAELLHETNAMTDYVSRVLLNEADGEEGGSNKDAEGSQSTSSTSSSSSGLSSVKATKAPLWLSLMRKLKKLWDKFKEIVTVGSKKKIEWLKKNKKYIEKKINIDGDLTLKYTPDFKMLDQFPIQDYNAVQNYLKSEEEFEKHAVKSISDSEGTVIERMEKAILGEEQTGKVGTLKTTVQQAYDYCTDQYTKSVDTLQKETTHLEKAQNLAIQRSKAKVKAADESANMSIEDYFTEFDASGVEKTGKEQNKEDKKTEKDNFDIYFKVYSRIISAKMSIYQKLFNEMYSYCKFYIIEAQNRSGVKTEDPDKSNNGGENNSGSQETVKMN